MNKWSYAISKQIPALTRSQQITIPTSYGEIVLTDPKDVQRVVQVLQRIAGKNELREQQHGGE